MEAGAALLLLGKVGEAERYLREAAANGAPPETVNFPLATALQFQGRYGEALPLLEALYANDPDFKFGEAELALARSLDESDDREGREAAQGDSREAQLHRGPGAPCANPPGPR